MLVVQFFLLSIEPRRGDMFFYGYYCMYKYDKIKRCPALETAPY